MDADPAAHGRSDRTQLALLSTRLGATWEARLAPLLRRGEVAVIHGLPEGIRVPARALAEGAHAQVREMLLGDLEPPVQEALRRTVPVGGVVYDVGANIGFFSLLAATLAGPIGRVIAWEPVAATALLAAEGAARSGLADRIDVRARAVSSAAGSEQLCIVGEAGWSHLMSRGHHPQTTAIVDVDVDCLDDVVAGGAPPPDVIKIDVEGSEADVLRGATAVLADHRPAVVCELHETNDEVCDLLEAAGYAVENLNGPTPVRTAGPVHVLARPRAT